MFSFMRNEVTFTHARLWQNTEANYRKTKQLLLEILKTILFWSRFDP